MPSHVSRRDFFRTTAAGASALALSGQTREAEPLRLWYKQPAADWNQALPLGNGRLGAMVFGGAGSERFQLNEDTLYSAEPEQNDIPLDITADFGQVTGLLREGRYVEADEYITAHWLGRAQPCYQPLADLGLEMDGNPGFGSYERELDLRRAVATTRFEAGGVAYTRESFISAPDQCLVVRMTAASRAKLALRIGLTTPHPTGKVTALGSDELLLEGQAPGFVLRRTLDYVEERHEQAKYPEIYDEEGKRLPHASTVLYGNDVEGRGAMFAVRLRVLLTGGRAKAETDALRVEGATEVIVVLAAATSYAGYDRSPSREGMNASQRAAGDLQAAARKPYSALLEAHTADHGRLFDRVGLKLGTDDPAKARRPTDERIRMFAADPDPSLAVLYYQYGRYLTIAGSRPGTQPLNLQGIWNHEVIPPWASAYTININAEMNYWLADAANLPECVEPMSRFLTELSRNGADVAREMYKRPGWVAHHNTTIWRGAQPVDGQARAAFWPMAAGWLARHLWDHYEYTGDRSYLAETAYPILKGAAEFLSAWLIEDENGRLTTPIGTSPENGFVYTAPDGQRRTATVSRGPSMDIEIIHDLFTHTIGAAKLLETDQPLQARLSSQLAKLRPLEIGSKGQLLEWEQEFEEAEPHHRHVSHLYALHPASQITPAATPDLANAARRTLELRGDEGTGWSLAWKINFWARLLDGEHAWRMMSSLFRLSGDGDVHMKGGGVYANLLCAHPPFQIDGNFGGAAGISEMLVQSHTGELHLLPAIPAAWSEGRLKGFCARGGFTILDMVWREGLLLVLVLESKNGAPCRLRLGEKTLAFDTQAGARYRVRGDLRKPERL